MASLNSTSADPSAAPSSSPEPSATPTPSLAPSSSAPPSPPPSSDQPSSTPVVAPSSASSAAPPPSSTPAPAPASSTNVPTSVITASPQAPSTLIITSIVTPTPTAPGEIVTPSVVIITVVSTPPPVQPTDGANSVSSVNPSPTTTGAAGFSDLNQSKSTKGLGTTGKTAIAVVVPVVVVALLVLAGIILWRKRKQRKNAEEDRRMEVEEYGFNPNHDPTLPAVGMQSEMAEDQSGGYRGWGNTTTSSGRKASTTLNSGMTHSDSNSNPGGYQGQNSPTAAGSDDHSVDALMNGRRETLDSEGIGALGAAPVASQNQAGVHRGPSNASSSYSAAGHSDNSGDYPLPTNNPQEYYDNNAYYAPNPYENNGYGNGVQPVIRDVSARRNTRIENPSVFPQQGNSGIAQNF